MSHYRFQTQNNHSTSSQPKRHVSVLSMTMSRPTVRKGNSLV